MICYILLLICISSFASAQFADLAHVDPAIFETVSSEMEERIEVLRKDVVKQIIEGQAQLGLNNPYVYIDLRYEDRDRSTYRYVREKVANELYSVFVEDSGYSMEVTEMSLEMGTLIYWTRVKGGNQGIMREVNRAARINFNKNA